VTNKLENETLLKEGIPAGHLFGIPIKLHYSWFIIFAVMVWMLSRDYFPAVYPHWSTTTSISAGIITIFLFFTSLLAHELMHSIVAQRCGIPVKSITLFFFGGVSQISEEPHAARIEFSIAVAGPLTSILLGAIFWLIWYLVSPSIDVIAAVSFWLGWTNIFLALFNFMPGFPLDGGRVLRSIIWWRTGNLRLATRLASYIGRGTGVIIILVGVWLIFNNEWWSGIWLGAIGWYLVSAAANIYAQLVMRQALEGHKVREILGDEWISVAPDLSIERLVNEYIRPKGPPCFVVVREENTLGLVTLKEVTRVPREEYGRVAVAQIMKPLAKLKRVTPDEDLSTVMNILTQDDLSQVLVVVNEKVIGSVTREDLLKLIDHDEHNRF
jgi:Zn-dependent protease/CBS domain-containing protein